MAGGDIPGLRGGKPDRCDEVYLCRSWTAARNVGVFPRLRARRERRSAVPFRQVWDSALGFEATIAGIVLAVVVLLTLFAIVRYRAGARKQASQQTEHKPVELAYAVAL